MKSAEEVTKHLNDIHVRALTAIEKAADDYRLRVLVPLCQKRGLSYRAGNGDFWFDDGSDALLREANHFPRTMRARMAEIFEVLNLPVLGSNTEIFGYFINDIDGEKSD